MHCTQRRVFSCSLVGLTLTTNAPKVDRALAERGISQPFGLGVGVVGSGGGGGAEEGEGGNESAAKLHEMKEEMDVSAQILIFAKFSSSLEGGQEF